MSRFVRSTESAESPHCIALQVATVRYNVEVKPAVTCDDAETSWSDEGRHLLCKQKAVGSSPTVSTTAKVLVRGHVVRRCPIRMLEPESAWSPHSGQAAGADDPLPSAFRSWTTP